MSKIILKNNKSLVLKNVLIRKLHCLNLDDLEGEIKDFKHSLKKHRVKTFGPLITKCYGPNVHKDGRITANYEIIIQAHDYLKYKSLFETRKSLNCGKCVYLRYSDEPEFMDFAFSKINMFITENNLNTVGVTYNAYVEQDHKNVVFEIFKPLAPNSSQQYFDSKLKKVLP
ncbi:hypothetical protein PRVXT_000266 [Proteinivorax tanatarense]|uniref:GyrI-like small molecule binding domain-containing protein n=1 Tax=Proteinivorax tanatarense TaxID=1260629 RepID=A0AAU7VM79_9FIRM